MDLRGTAGGNASEAPDGTAAPPDGTA
jgi:hypothetical protein